MSDDDSDDSGDDSKMGSTAATGAEFDSLLEERAKAVLQAAISTRTTAEATGALDNAAQKRRPLTAAELQLVLDSFASPALLADRFGLEILGKDIQCLRPGQWLNDEVMNFQFELMRERSAEAAQNPTGLVCCLFASVCPFVYVRMVFMCPREHSSTFLMRWCRYLFRGPHVLCAVLCVVCEHLGVQPRKRCHFFNTFFYKKLTGERGGYNYKIVRRWTKKLTAVKLPDYDYCFIPIHVQHSHWCLACINFQAKRILYYDSLRGPDYGVMQHLLQYVHDESMDKLQRPVNMDEWQLELVEKVPHQLNGFDCGVFTCKMADYLGEGLPLSFTQTDMPYFRQRILLEIKLMSLNL